MATAQDKERIRQARNLASAAYQANRRLGLSHKEAREQSKVFVPKETQHDNRPQD